MNAALATIQVYVKQANAWRDTYNPLRQLTMQRVVSFLEAGQRGAYADLQWFYHLMEPADATVAGLLARRLSAMKRLDSDLRATPEDELPRGVSKQLVEEQRVAARELLDGIDNLREAIEFLALASFRQYAHLEKHHADWTAPRAGNVSHLEPVPQWYWVREGLNGPWEFNGRAVAGTNRGQAIEPGEFIIREIERPINRVAAVAFVRKALSTKDWDGFIETYGIPMVFVIGPPNVGKDKETEYQSIAEEMIGNGRGYLPNGADVKNPGAETRGVNPFRDHLRYQDEQIVLAGTSGVLTMLTEAGSGTLAGTAHRDTFDKIADAEGKDIAQTALQRQLVGPLLDELFPRQPHLVHCELSGGDPEGMTKVLEDATKARNAGYQIDADQLAEKTGYKLTPTPAPAALPWGGSLANRLRNRSEGASAPSGTLASDPVRNNLSTALAAARRDDLAPVREAAGSDLLQRLETALAMTDEAFAVELAALQPELAALRGKLPKLLEQVNADPATAKVMMDGVAAEFFNAMAAEAAEQELMK